MVSIKLLQASGGRFVILERHLMAIPIQNVLSDLKMQMLEQEGA
jgi:hypothetical protein